MNNWFKLVQTRNQPIRLPGLILRPGSGQGPGVCSGLILSGAFNPCLKIGVWRRRTYQFFTHCVPSPTPSPLQGERGRVRGKERNLMEKNWEAMDAIFKPKAVAVIGASDNPGKLGSHVMKSLIQGRYPGKIYPVNPGKEEIFGIKTYPSLSRVPDPVDLSIIVLPAEQVPRIIKECQEKDIKGIVLITAGFKEIEDKRGEVLQKEITELADRSGIKVIGRIPLEL